jgi:hypothetical protein
LTYDLKLIVFVVVLQLGDTSLPDEEPAAWTDVEKLDEELLQKLHHVLLEVSRCPPTYSIEILR